jgi:hypothetical protein
VAKIAGTRWKSSLESTNRSASNILLSVDVFQVSSAGARKHRVKNHYIF